MISVVHHYRFGGNPDQSTSIFRIQAAGCRGEAVNASFGICSDSGPIEVEISSSDLIGNGSLIPAHRIDVFVIKQRWKAGSSSIADGAVLVPELFVKDDRVELRDSYRREFFDWNHLVKAAYLYEPPAIRLVGNACTTVDFEQTKLVWVSIKIPEDITAGAYRGHVKIASASTQQSISLELEVHPFDLDRPRQDLLLWYKGTLDWRASLQHYVDQQRMSMELCDIYDHGFNAISLNETNENSASRATAIAAQSGFNSLVVVGSQFPEQSTKSLSRPVLYAADEPDLHTSSEPSETDPVWRKLLANVALAASRDMPVMISLVKSSSIDKILALTALPAPAIVSLLMPQNRNFFLFAKQLAKFKQLKLFYYWICSIEAPLWNRALAGFFLYASGADGISPYCYLHLPQQYFSPLNDFDPWEPKFTVQGRHLPFRDHMTVYPSKEGIVSTIQWEALREGISDLRYVTTLENLLDIAENSNRADILPVCSTAREFLLTIRDTLAPHLMNSQQRSTTQPFADVDTTTFDHWRNQCVILCKELQTALKKGDGTT